MTIDQPTPACGRDRETYRPGHLLHFIHSRIVTSLEPRWRPMVVSLVDGDEAILVHEATGTTVVIWHHRTLEGLVRAADRVLLDERRHALRVEGQLLNVRLTGQLPPAAPDEIDERPTSSVVDIATGRGFVVGQPAM